MVPTGNPMSDPRCWLACPCPDYSVCPVSAAESRPQGCSHPGASPPGTLALSCLCSHPQTEGPQCRSHPLRTAQAGSFLPQLCKQRWPRAHPAILCWPWGVRAALFCRELKRGVAGVGALAVVGQGSSTCPEAPLQADSSEPGRAPLTSPVWGLHGAPVSQEPSHGPVQSPVILRRVQATLWGGKQQNQQEQSPPVRPPKPQRPSTFRGGVAGPRLATVCANRWCGFAVAGVLDHYPSP